MAACVHRNMTKVTCSLHRHFKVLVAFFLDSGIMTLVYAMIGIIGTLRKLDGNATTAAKTIWLKQVIVKKVCLPLSIVRSQYSLRRNNARLHNSNEFY